MEDVTKQKIDGLKANISRLKGEMERVREEVIKESIPIIKGAIEEEAKRHVIYELGVTEKIGEEQIKEMKGKICQLQDKVAKMVEKSFSNPNVFPHLEKTENTRNLLSLGKVHEAIVKETMSQISGKSIDIIKDYGYDGGHRPHETRGRFSSPFPKVTENWNILVKEYSSFYDSYYTDIEELRKIEEEISQKKALSLWERA